MKEGQIFLNCDYKGKIPVSVAIRSVLESANPARPLRIHLVHDDGFESDGGCTNVREIVARYPFATVVFANITALLEKHPEFLGAKWPPMTWAWTFCTDIFPELTGNLVFIDWDMYVLKDLGELYDLDLEGQGFVAAAVNESRREHRPLLVSAGWPEEAGYSVNTGIQVINTDAFRREHLREKMFAWYTAHKDIAECVEQDSANVIYGERILRLHIKYNYTVGWLERAVKMNPFRKEWRVFPTRDVLEAMLDPTVVHFIGHQKPWRFNHRPYRHTYRRAMSELGLLENGRLPGETPAKKAVAVLFDGYHGLLKLYARLLLALISPKAPSPMRRASSAC